MADFISPNEGNAYIGTAGIPATVYADLSTKSVDSTNPYSDASAYATRGQITGTGYSRGTLTRVVTGNGTFTFGTATFSTGAATNWPANVRSLAVTNGTNRLLWAWNLQTGGGARDMSAASTTENVIGTVVVE